MSEIVTITFSPCIDKSTSVARLIPEKKLQCNVPKLEPGGGGINVARAIRNLDGHATAIFPAGGYTGKFFIDLLHKDKISSIIIKTENETRENIIIFDESSRLQYRFGMPASPLRKDEWKKMLDALDHLSGVKYIVASGSLPPGVPPSVFADIASIAKKKNAKFIADTSGEALKYAAAAGVFLLKPSVAELASLAGKNHLPQEDISFVARQLINTGGCHAVVVSMGSEGALLVTATIKQLITPPLVETKSTVGAGDSLVAGIVFSLYEGSNLETATRFGVACGTAATLNPGSELCKPDDVKRLFRMISKSDNP